jgi:hypothetical protein
MLFTLDLVFVGVFRLILTFKSSTNLTIKFGFILLPLELAEDMMSAATTIGVRAS